MSVIETRDFPGNPTFGLKRLFHFDHATGEFHIETKYQVPVDANRRQFNSFDERSRHKETNHIMRIPLSLYFELQKQGVFEDDKRFSEFVNDPNFSKMRTRPGRY